MTHQDSKVDYDDLSSGDSNRPKPKQYQEENNNEVDELSKELSEMGCIVDTVKRPPNICVETCVYESEDEKEKSGAEEDAYSDEFEDDKSEEEESIKLQPKSTSDMIKSQPVQSSMKLSKSQSSMSHRPPASNSGRTSTDYGSISVPSTRRINMSFTNERLRDIERHNHILLTKILSARNTKKSSIPSRDQAVRKPLPSAAVLRKNQQREIDRENMILLKKIQRAKSSMPGVRR